MEDLLQENLMYLYHHHKDLFEQIQQYMDVNDEKNCKIVYGENGIVNLSYVMGDSINLLYADDESDIKEWMKGYEYLSNAKCDIVMYGLGLTHHLAHMIEMNPKLNFYIFEPEIDIFIEAMKVLQLDQLLQHPQVKMLRLGNSEEKMQMFYALLHTYSELVKVDVFIPFYTNININSMRKYYDFNYSFREAEAIEYGFEGLFGTVPYRNSIRNLEKMYYSNSIKALKNKFEGCTALIVGAGPSLELDMEYIKKFADRLLIISAGSSVQSLLHFNIRPNLCVTMDPGKANGRAFSHNDVHELSLVYVPQVFYGILEQDFAQTFYTFFNNDPIIDYIMPEIDPQSKMRANNSVTGTAIQVASYIGASTIMLAGQDFSFPNDQYYAMGTKHASKKYLTGRIKESYLEVENVAGSINNTNSSMRAVQEDIERLISSMQGKKFINTSSLGAKIKGADFIPFLQAVNQIESKYNFDELRRFFSIEQQICEFDRATLLQRIEGVTTICNELIGNIDTSLRLIKKIDEFSRINPNKAMNHLIKLERVFSKVTEHSLFKMVIPAWNRGLTKKYDQQVIKIEAEPTIIGKAKLLNEIVVPYMETIRTSFNDIQAEFQQVYEKIGDNMIEKKR